MGVKRLFYAVLICSALAGNPAWAGGSAYDTAETSSPQKVVDGMATKAVRGLANITCGWLELPKQIYVTASEDGVAKGALIGPLKGIGMTVVRTATGVVELATFVLPYPGFYDPFFDPAFVWGRE